MCSILFTAACFLLLNTHCSPMHNPLRFNAAKMFLLSHSKNLLNEILNYWHINLGRIFEVQKLSMGSCQLPTYTTHWPCNSLYIVSISVSELLCFRLCHRWWISNNKESSLSNGMIVENIKKANPTKYCATCFYASRSARLNTAPLLIHTRLRKENTTNSFQPQADLSNLQGEDTLHLLLLWASAEHFSVPITVCAFDLGVTVYIQVYFVWYISNAKSMH